MTWDKSDYKAYALNVIDDLKQINELKFECLEYFDTPDEFCRAYVKFTYGDTSPKKRVTVRLLELNFNNFATRQNEIKKLDKFLEYLRGKGA